MTKKRTSRKGEIIATAMLCVIQAILTKYDIATYGTVTGRSLVLILIVAVAAFVEQVAEIFEEDLDG